MRSDLRHNFHLSLGTAPFEVDLRKDIIHDAQGKDPGIYTRAHELLRPYARIPDPKEAVLRTMRVFRKKSFSVVFKQICLQVSLRSCTDPEFERLCSALHQWFPYKTE